MENRSQSMILLICFVFIILFQSAILAESNLPHLIKQVESSIVVVLSYNENGDLKAKGSGFFINKYGDVITNRHVPQGASTIKIKTSDGKFYNARIQQDNSLNNDLVHLKLMVSLDSTNFLSISENYPELGERVIVIGHPLGLERTVTDGIVSAIRNVQNYGKTIQITAPISEGSSGSPVINMNGNVVGVATFQYSKGQNLNFAIPLIEYKSNSDFQLTMQSFQPDSNIGLDAEELFLMGLFSLSQNDYEKACYYFHKVVERDSLFADAYFQTGFCNYKLARYSESITAFNQFLALKPGDSEAYYNLALVYGEIKNIDQAIANYQEALQIDSTYYKSHYNLAVLYNKEKKYDCAVKHFQKTVRFRPRFAEAYFGLGLSYGHLNQNRQAIESFKQAIIINPDYYEAYIGLGMIYSSLKNIDDKNITNKVPTEIN